MKKRSPCHRRQSNPEHSVRHAVPYFLSWLWYCVSQLIAQLFTYSNASLVFYLITWVFKFTIFAHGTLCRYYHLPCAIHGYISIRQYTFMRLSTTQTINIYCHRKQYRMQVSFYLTTTGFTPSRVAHLQLNFVYIAPFRLGQSTWMAAINLTVNSLPEFYSHPCSVT